VTKEHKELMKDMTGGVQPELYRIYAKMLELNETCEKFVAASSDKSKQGGAAAQTVLSSEMEVPSLE
jgi:hypothetical protein